MVQINDWTRSVWVQLVLRSDFIVLTTVMKWALVSVSAVLVTLMLSRLVDVENVADGWEPVALSPLWAVFGSFDDPTRASTSNSSFWVQAHSKWKRNRLATISCQSESVFSQCLLRLSEFQLVESGSRASSLSLRQIVTVIGFWLCFYMFIGESVTSTVTFNTLEWRLHNKSNCTLKPRV